MIELALALGGVVLSVPIASGGVLRDREHRQGRSLVREAVARLVGVDSTDVVIEATPLGAPYVVGHPNVCISISHTRGLVVAGAVFGDYFGIDVEWADRDVSRLARALNASEHALTRDEALEVLDVLVAKEAVAKSWGTGLAGGMARWPIVGFGAGWVEVGGAQGVRRAALHRVDVGAAHFGRQALIAVVADAGG